MKLFKSNKIFLIILLLLVARHAYAEKNSKIKLLTEYMNELREEKPITINSEEIISGDQEIILSSLNKYKNDGSLSVRYHTYALIWKIGRYSINNKLRMQAVESLVNGCTDPDPLVWQHASNWLLDFNAIDFSDKAKDQIRNLINENNIRREIVRIVGVANMRDFNETLKELLIDEAKYESEAHSGRWYGTVGWAARLALARMGNKEHIVHAIKIVESEPDIVIRVTHLLKDLDYIRQPEIIKILRNYLESNKRLPRVKKSAPGTRYNQYALDILTKSIKEFPVKIGYVGEYSQKDIKYSINWLKKRKKLKIIK